MGHNMVEKMLFPDIQAPPVETLPRALPASACVTRYAPSPTGFLHIGGVYTALISERIAHQSGGVFFLRIEDTDKQREIADGVRMMTEGLARFDIQIDEGVHADMMQTGAYGSYIQSERLHLYRAFAQQLVESGRAYPCFCTPQELEHIRETQELQKIKTGYYGRWARCRTLGSDEVAARIARAEQWALRLKSGGADGHKIQFSDLIKGKLTLTANDNDAILLKSDGYPTYHWAHCVDDHLMGTTHVIRGDEWLSSVPLHLELFAAMGWQTPHYAHIAPIVKIDETGSKRKLSKRKDAEANVTYYFERGYPVQAIKEYLLNLINPDFEDWRREHPDASLTDFTVRLEKANVSGALFDFVKLDDVSKSVISRMSASAVYDAVLAWAREYDANFAVWLSAHEEYATRIFDIERSGEKRRKDIAMWSQVKENISYFMSDDIVFTAPEKLSRETAREIVERLLASLDFDDSPDAWLEKLRILAASLGFAPDTKTFKAAPEKFAGHLGDVAMVVRLALTGRTNTPDLYQMIQVLGEQRARDRLARAAQSLK